MPPLVFAAVVSEVKVAAVVGAPPLKVTAVGGAEYIPGLVIRIEATL